MKKYSFLIFILLIACVTAKEQDNPLIAVLDFEIEGLSESDMTAFISLLLSGLSQTGKYSVIDLDKRNTILEELEFLLDNCTDSSCLLEAGRILSADMIVTGSIRKSDSRYLVEIKMLEIETGKLVCVADGSYDTIDDMFDSVFYFAGILSGDMIPEPEESLLDMVFVEGGRFLMGSGCGHDDEQPVHEVTVSSFYMSRYEGHNRAVWHVL